MQSILTKISEIKMNPSNPRTIKDAKFKKLVQSIQEFPKMLEIRPIVVNDDMIVLGGNMRLKACIEAGLTEVPVIKASDLTEEQQKEFIIKDNVGFGEWDMGMLQAEWNQNDLEKWGLDDLRFVETNEGLEEDDYDAGDVGAINTNIKLGDILTLSGGGVTHKLICGSATEEETFEKLLDGEKATMVFTDPPYLMNFEGGMSGDGSKNDRHEVIMNDNLGKDEGDQFLYDFLVQLKKYCGGGWYISFYRLGIDRMFQALAKADLKWRNLIIWKKNHKNLSNSDYQSIYEPVFYGYADDYTPILYGWTDDHTFRGAKGVHNDVIDDIPPRPLPSIWEVDRTKVNDLHPTMKPVELVARMVMNSSRKGESVLDLFLGSGTTMVACHQLKRNCYGIELDPKYCQVIIDRMQKYDSTLKITHNGKPYG